MEARKGDSIGGRGTAVGAEEPPVTNASGRSTSVLGLGRLAEEMAACGSQIMAKTALHSTLTQRDSVTKTGVPQPSRFGKCHTTPPAWKCVMYVSILKSEKSHS